MDKGLKLSIITPSYNQGRFIMDTINSVLNQDYSDYEHIIIDGGSTDETLKILKKSKHINWISEKDDGAANAINKGFNMATGDILAWLNSDDYYDENIFKAVVDSFNYDKNINLVYGGVTFISEDKKIICRDENNDFDLNHLIHKSADSLRQPCIFFRRELLEKTGLLNENYKCAFDYDFFLKMLRFSYTHHLKRNLVFIRDYKTTLSRRYQRKQGMEIIKLSMNNGAKIYEKIVIANFIKKVLFNNIFYKNKDEN